MEKVRVLVVDDHMVFRQGLVKLLECSNKIEVIGEASNGCEAELKASQLRPDVILMDLRMPGQNGIETTRHIRNERPDSKILFLTVSETDSDLFDALATGARGYLLKTLSLEEVESAIITVCQGQAVISPPHMMTKLLSEFALSHGHRDVASKVTCASLSDREKDILRLIVSGATNKEVAVRLCIAETTVKTHLRNILDKLHINNRVELALFAFREGWAPERN